MYGDYFTGYRNVKKGCIIGPHFYTIMPMSNHGFTIVNGVVYEMMCDDNGIGLTFDQNEFWNTESESFRSWKQSGYHNILVRFPFELPKQNIKVPSNFELANYVQKTYGPK